jgi:hypothetical protein
LGAQGGFTFLEQVPLATHKHLMNFMHDPSLSLSAVYPGNVFLGAVCIGSSTVEVNSNTDNPNCHFKIETELREKKQSAKVVAMIDSGAQGSFMHQEFAVTNKVPMLPMQNPVRLTNIDGTPNDAGSLTHHAVLDVAIDGRIIPTVFFVTNISAFDVILGISWL